MCRLSSWAVLLIVSTVISYQLHAVDGKFGFALPGKWGHNKRGQGGPFSFSLPGKWGNHKRSATSSLNCEETNPDIIFAMYETIQHEAMRINECLLLEGNEVNDGPEQDVSMTKQ